MRHGATSEEVQAARFAVDSRKWIASKLLRDRYGDKVVNTHGGVSENPIIARIEHVIVDPKPRLEPNKGYRIWRPFRRAGASRQVCVGQAE